MKKVKEWHRQHPYFIAVIGAVLILLVLHNFHKEPYQKRYYPCLDYIEKGTLYDGQLFCTGPPLAFYIPYGLEKMLGGQFQSSLHFLLILIHVIGFLLVLLMVKKETTKVPLILIAVLYLIFIYPISDHGPEYFLDADLSYLFLLGGIYVLYYTHLRFKGTLALILFLISLLNKLSSLPGILFFTVWYFLYLNPTREKKKPTLKRIWWICFNPYRFREVLPGIGLALIILMGLKFIFPNMFIYALWMHIMNSEPQVQPIVNALLDIITFSPFINFLYLFYVVQTLFLGALLWKKEWKPFLLYSIIGWWALFFSRYRYHSDYNSILSTYTLPVLPWVIISIVYLKEKYYEQWCKNSKYFMPFYARTMACIIMVFVLLNFYGDGYKQWVYRDIEQEKMHLQQQVLSGIKYLEIPQHKKVLVQSPSPNYTKNKLAQLNLAFAQTEFIELLSEDDTNIQLEDATTQVLRELLGNKTIQPTTEEVSPKIKEIIQLIKHGEIGVIVYTPPQWALIRRIIQDPEVEEIIKDKYCYVAYPDFEYIARQGLDVTGFFIQKNAQHNFCTVPLTIALHYQKVAEELCPQSATAVNIINKFLKRNNIPPVVCAHKNNNAEDFVDRYTRRSTLKYDTLMVLVIISLNGIVTAYVVAIGNSKKKKG